MSEAAGVRAWHGSEALRTLTGSITRNGTSLGNVVSVDTYANNVTFTVHAVYLPRPRIEIAGLQRCDVGTSRDR
jgi:hypothetical protein